MSPEFDPTTTQAAVETVRDYVTLALHALERGDYEHCQTYLQSAAYWVPAPGRVDWS